MSIEMNHKTGDGEVTGGENLLVSPAPHLHAKRSTKDVMFLVCLALLLPTAGGIYYFGVYTIFVVLVSVVTCILTELAAKMLRKREFVMDGSAIVTGMLLALVLPPRIPLWAVVIGAAFSIALVKEAFGGLGHNIFNPALAGRAFLSVSFAGLMTRWIAPVSSPADTDAVTTATPLSESFTGTGSTHDLYRDLFLGNVGGCIGETSALLILVGGLILLAAGVIKWRIPAVFIGTVFLLTWLIPGEDPVFHILAGGLFLGAFFMATDYVTAPLTGKGQFIFAAGAGVLVVMVRLYGSMPEGVAYSILLMNAFTPLIDRYVRPRPYGYVPPPKSKDEKKKNEGKRDEGKKDEKKKNEGKRDEGKKDEKKRDEGKKDEGKKDEGKKNEGKRDEGKKDEKKRDEGKKDEGKKDEGKKDERKRPKLKDAGGKPVEGEK